MSLGNVLGSIAPIAAGYFGGPALAGATGWGSTASSIAAGALAGGGIAALSGGDILGGAAMGGLSGMGGGALRGAADSVAQQALLSGSTDAAINASALSPFTGSQAAISPFTPAGTFGTQTASTALGNAGMPALTGGGTSGLTTAANNIGPNFARMSPGKMAGQGIRSGFDASQLAADAGGYNPSSIGRGIDSAGAAFNDTDAFFSELGGGNKAMGMGKLGLTAAGPITEAFAPEPLSYDDYNKDEKYDPNRTLNLNMDTGINEALTKDSGLRLLAQGGYLDGGMLPGDGMSDDVPANIDGEQEAALSQGEFVVPADVVSHLGNGSSDAGSKKLYAMMDKVRMARTGNKQQGKQINPERYMPA